MLIFGAIFIHTFYLHFALLLLDKIRELKYILFFSYAISILFAILDFTPFLIVNFNQAKFSFKFWPDANLLMSSFIFIEVFIAYYTGYLFYREYRATSDYSRKNQMKYLFILTFLGFSGGFTNWFYWYDIPISPFGNVLVTVYLSLTTYAILKHHLLDIDLVIRKGLIYSVLVTIISIAYLLLVFASETIFRGFMGYKSIPWTLSIILLFAILFQPLKSKIQYFVDRIFFKKTTQEMEQENIRLREELQRSEKLKAVGTLAAGMAHEIKNPLTSIKTFTEYLPKKYNDKKFIDKFQRIVSSEVDKINDIVGQLLDFAKPKPLDLKDWNIQNLLDETLDFLSNDLIKHKIKVIKNYTVLNPTIRIDPRQIKQAILNIILNAIDAMKNKGGQLMVFLHKDSEQYKIGIEDTGCGINRKDLPHLFDPFYSTKDTNTGLGLSIVHGIIEKHNGRIEVENALGKGTKFTIYLPKISP
ncbi:MAG: hypothetical protein ISS92_01025 [Candidatus Omnitrophica bacterium]|nr:hypothetical protein [Candidatus Omnitrophota bacterium]